MIAAVLTFAMALLATGQSQHTNTNAGFLVDASKPFVYIAYERIGSRTAVGEGETNTGVFLRIVNNCRVPIRVRTFNANKPQLEHEVVYDDYHGTGGGMRIDGTIDPPAKIPQSEMPQGYSFDVVSSEVIRSGEGFRFSVPVTHVSRDWHIEVPFEFDLPATSCCQPRMQAQFTINDVPEKDKHQFRQR